MKKKATDKKNPILLQLPHKPLPQYKIFRMLKKRTKPDLDFKGSSIYGSMCTQAPKIALKTFFKYNQVNLGDPGLFIGSNTLEQEAIQLLGHLLHGESCKGAFVTGGTEANILAVQCALNQYLSQFLSTNKPHRSQLKLIVPQSAHFSFQKAAMLTGVQLVKIPLNSEYQMDLTYLKQQIDEQTFCIVGVAGTTGLGVIDPIQRLNAIATEKNIHLHIDAAFGGFVIPFMDSLFKEKNCFDFQLKGVQSITIDPHKMGRGVTPGGVILYRNEKIAGYSATPVSYLAGGETCQFTLVGTRSGGAVLACYASMLNEGLRGYRKQVEKAMKLTQYLADKIKKMKSYKLVIEPTINVVGITPLFCTASDLGKRLREKGVAVSVFDHYIRIVMMPHITQKKIDKLHQMLKEIAHD